MTSKQHGLVKIFDDDSTSQPQVSDHLRQEALTRFTNRWRESKFFASMVMFSRELAVYPENIISKWI